MKISELTKEMHSLNRQIKTVLHNSGFEKECQFIPDNEFDNLTADERQLVDVYDTILNKLDIISDRLEYLSKPITHEGKLCLSSNDRFTVDGCELCCGYRIEVLRYDDYDECYRWVIDRVEYSKGKGGYYIYGRNTTMYEGMTVRIRY